VIKGLPDVAAIWISRDGEKTIAGWRIHFSESDSPWIVEESNVETKWLQNRNRTDAQ